MSRLMLFVLAIVCCGSLLAANQITLIESSRQGVKLEWKLDSYTVTTIGEYTLVEFPGGCGLYEVGGPNLPSKQAFLEIPMDAQPLIRIARLVVETKKITKPVAPAQEPPIDTIGAERLLPPVFVQNPKTYLSSEPFPARVVEIAYEGIMRGRRLALLRVNPIQYLPKTSELKIYRELVIELTFQGATKELAQTDAAMEPIAQGLVLNYLPAAKKELAAVQYLILTVPDLQDHANRFAAFKTGQGINTKVEILPNNPTVATVKDTIKKYYPGVTYVLILGGHNLIGLPTTGARHPLGKERCHKLGIADETVPSDLFYSCVEGTDYYPDIYVGRIPARKAAEAELLLNKIMQHQANLTAAAKWQNRFLLCGEFQYQYSKTNMAERLFCETAFTIWNSLKTQYVFPTKTIGTGSSGLGHAEYFFRKAANPADPTKPGTYRSKMRDMEEPIVDCKMPTEWSANIVSDTQAKANALAFWNEGAFLVQHRDHGSETSWGKPSITKTDVASLSNGTKLPILFSINCLTGAMDYSSDCLVEAALKNPNGGAAAALGSTRVSYSWWNDRLCDGFYTCLYGTGVYDCMDVGVKLPTNHPFSKKLGVVLNFGKMYLALNYPSNPWGTSYDYTETEFYLFHCIGDPDMDIFSGK